MLIPGRHQRFLLRSNQDTSTTEIFTLDCRQSQAGPARSGSNAPMLSDEQRNVASG